MRILILSNWSQNIAELNSLTAPNKHQYADKHGYSFENVEIDYNAEGHVKWLEIIKSRLEESFYDVVITVGCDVLFMNQAIKIEDRIGDFYGDHRVSVAREHLSWWPINNDVMIWPAGIHSQNLLGQLLLDQEKWLSYPWLWQAHLWDLIQGEHSFSNDIRIVEPREMNSTFQPFMQRGTEFTRLIGPSSWQFGDWILHALDMSPEMRLNVIRWALPFVGNCTYAELPKEITGRK